MKFLKLFNEHKSEFDSIDNLEQLEIIKELGEARFAYLYDDNFVFRAVLSKPDCILIALYINEFTEYRIRPSFNWFDIKDYFIPFLESLTSDFEINYESKGKNKRGISFNYPDYLTYGPPSNKTISVEDILKDKLENETINAIFVYVKSNYFIF
jgi:hypothetical protein